MHTTLAVFEPAIQIITSVIVDPLLAWEWQAIYCRSLEKGKEVFIPDERNRISRLAS